MFRDLFRGRMLTFAVVAAALQMASYSVAGAAPTLSKDQATPVAAVTRTSSDTPEGLLPSGDEDAALIIASPTSLQVVTMDPSATLSPTASIASVEHTVIPVPPAAWTGMLSLGAMTLMSCRKSIARFFT